MPATLNWSTKRSRDFCRHSNSLPICSNPSNPLMAVFAPSTTSPIESSARQANAVFIGRYTRNRPVRLTNRRNGQVPGPVKSRCFLGQSNRRGIGDKSGNVLIFRVDAVPPVSRSSDLSRSSNPCNATIRARASSASATHCSAPMKQRNLLGVRNTEATKPPIVANDTAIATHPGTVHHP